ncbi:MAG TPA: bifunctional phosphopantothenoylcysteine decarboxylase/phosphopantothenate--cysteine ligase CoaBC [Flavobacterium sp.]|uniref:bifunctional phosphopantothenoylcysteine decarboxylase/phosphopantothenate--cysteine ligase CoaBC n=1 Tax=unclassified Flavobacterium TaxID=196869 RepID=UPI0025BB02BD|nr:MULTISPECIES: bifunctional phosphopantothenoylcysteine decarboxylase/phosphopantothenate--cysteine ligase CoaBC [unclassified Flavobacterium]HRE77063.1 bifunctional phosphopantothenoylcysteine decarboxylase/phosphopantothenate--cysteine ligase CoaBC [Flavobacterium sp.]
MSVLNGKKILLGVTGGIAAYKTASLVRLFIKAGAQVQVVMTPASKDFVTPLTLSTLSKNPVFSEFYNEEDENALWNNHVELGLWADLMIIAPATANTLSKMANGNCDNLLMATYLSAKCPVYFAPAMDLDMYKHPTSIDNFHKLQLFGNIMIPAESGELASGLSGEGRMAEPENIISFLENDILQKLPLKGKKILITAGPTYEAIDPVRFIGNHSSGKMGFDIANEAVQLGAEVILISGPTHLNVTNNGIKLIRVQSAEEMYQQCHLYFGSVDVAIAAAAVADYKPKVVANQKIKKSDSNFSIELEKTKDILASLGEIKKNQFLVGFALETENEIEHAKLKIQKKNLDLIVLNSLNDEGAGFGKATNKVTFIDKSFHIEPMPLKSKEEVAKDILNKIIQQNHA